jgi:hypothetical protein
MLTAAARSSRHKIIPATKSRVEKVIDKNEVEKTLSGDLSLDANLKYPVSIP